MDKISREVPPSNGAPAKLGRRATRRRLLGRMAAALALTVGLAGAASAQTAADLTRSLTPMGAIRAGNGDGTIPPWTGGLQGTLGANPGRYRADPFAKEKPLFAITAQNVDRYADKLAVGTIAMLRTLPGFHIEVYPTHRTYAAPKFIYDNAIANATRAHLSANGLDVIGAQLAVPFPIPHNGAEAIWNHTLRWRGEQILRTSTNAISTPNGAYSLERWQEKIMLPYNSPNMSNPKKWDSLFWQEILAPPRVAGVITLVVSYQDPSVQPREAWSYYPGERRVRRAPEIDYDTPLPDTDGLETTDDYDMFNGAIDRFSWKLVGRKELYVPYNTYELQNPAFEYSDIVQKQYANPDLIRFELHRVWVVEATLKPDFRHIYSRRTFYLDEDSWQCLVADKYDGRGNLWRTSFAFPIEFTEVPALGADGYEYVDLYQHRFLMQGMHNQEPRAPLFDAGTLNPREFTAEGVRRAGRR